MIRFLLYLINDVGGKHINFIINMQIINKLFYVYTAHIIKFHN